MDEFAMGSSCENSAFQNTRNPWHLGSVPGGSSGGSAAAVAAATVPLALGSDTGGSIRQPAALCGVVGLKPSYGRVSRYGLVAFGSSLDQIGPLARRVRDAALALRVIAGPDHRDSTAAPRAGEDYLAGIERGIAGVRVGTIAELDTEALGSGPRRSFERALAELAAAGAELEVVSIPNLGAAVAAYYVLANSEASANLARFDGIRYGRRAPDAHNLSEVYTESRSLGFGPEVKRRIMLGTFALSSGYYEQYYGLGRGVAAALRLQFERAFARVDVLVTPTTPTAAFGIGEKVGDPLAMYLSDVFTTPANLVGVPAIAVPSGLDERGLPLSLQIMARPFEEALALRVARALELRLGLDHRPGFQGEPERAGGSEVERG
jgi:aspartyl-tRNA(Asn)/glutamyl-tRNA(Gln) amidotransferase subunit A